jgi:hypothetical protein
MPIRPRLLKLGGSVAVKIADIEEEPLPPAATAEAVRSLLAHVIVDVRTKRLDPKVALSTIFSWGKAENPIWNVMA